MLQETVTLITRMNRIVNDGFGLAYPAVRALSPEQLADPDVVTEAIKDAPIHNDPDTPDAILVALDDAVGAFTRLVKTCSAYIQDGEELSDGP